MAALTELGMPYRYATSEPAVGFDCSGLTSYAWRRAGVDIANQSGAQIRAAAPRDHASAMAGDLVQYPGHVMLYLGVGDAIVHAVNRSDGRRAGLRQPQRALRQPHRLSSARGEPARALSSPSWTLERVDRAVRVLQAGCRPCRCAWR